MSGTVSVGNCKDFTFLKRHVHGHESQFSIDIVIGWFQPDEIAFVILLRIIGRIGIGRIDNGPSGNGIGFILIIIIRFIYLYFADVVTGIVPVDTVYEFFYVLGSVKVIKKEIRCTFILIVLDLIRLFLFPPGQGELLLLALLHAGNGGEIQLADLQFRLEAKEARVLSAEGHESGGGEG